MKPELNIACLTIEEGLEMAKQLWILQVLSTTCSRSQIYLCKFLTKITLPPLHSDLLDFGLFSRLKRKANFYNIYVVLMCRDYINASTCCYTSFLLMCRWHRVISGPFTKCTYTSWCYVTKWLLVMFGFTCENWSFWQC